MRKALLLSVVSAAVAVVACGSGADDPALAQVPAATPRADEPVVAPALTAPPAARDPVAETRPSRATDLAGGSKDSLFPREFDPCDLISMEEAAEAAGAPVRAPQSRWGARDSNCIFPAQDGDDSWPGAVLLQIRAGETAYDKTLELGKEMVASENATLEMLDGVGDRAFYITFEGHNIVVAAKGRTTNLIVRDNPAAPNREQAIDLARRIVQRLQ